MKKAYDDKGWSSHIKELKKFKEKFGHCNVRRTQKEYLTLSYWIRRVRGLYKLRKAGKRTTLTDERIAELDDLGFGWEGWSANRADVFETRLKELKRFHKLHGHCRLPSPHPENPALKSWTVSIRQKMRQQNSGGKATLTPWQVEQLEALGFEFETPEAQGSWKKQLRLLRTFKEVHGHCEVPYDFPELGQWVAYVHEEMDKGEESSLFSGAGKQKLAELEAVSFVPRRDYGKFTKNQTLEDLVTSSSCDESQSLEDEEPEEDDDDGEEEPPQEQQESSKVIPLENTVAAPSSNPFSGLASLAEICRVVSEEEKRNAQQEQPSVVSSIATPSPEQQEDKPTEKGEITLKKPPGSYRKRKSKEGYGHWTAAEHDLFLQGLGQFGRKWTKIASKIPSRSTSQVRSHAQKYFDKMKRDHEDIHRQYVDAWQLK